MNKLNLKLYALVPILGLSLKFKGQIEFFYSVMHIFYSINIFILFFQGFIKRVHVLYLSFKVNIFNYYRTFGLRKPASI